MTAISCDVSDLLPGRDVCDRQVPVAVQDFEAPLLFPLEGLLIRPELLGESILFRIGSCGHRRVLELNGYAIIPSRVLRHMVRGSLNLYGKHPSTLHVLLEQRIVVPQK